MKILRRWLPASRIILTTDGGFANVALAWTSLKYGIALVSRLRHDARLFDFAPEKQGCGRPEKKGHRLMPPREMLSCPDLKWTEAIVKWYGGKKRRIA